MCRVDRKAASSPSVVSDTLRNGPTCSMRGFVSGVAFGSSAPRGPGRVERRRAVPACRFHGDQHGRWQDNQGIVNRRAVVGRDGDLQPLVE